MPTERVVDHLGLAELLVEVREHRRHESAQFFIARVVRHATNLRRQESVGQRGELLDQRRQLGFGPLDHRREEVRQSVSSAFEAA